MPRALRRGAVALALLGAAPSLAATHDSTPYGSVLVGDVVYFTADDGVHGRELWRSDGTGPGTRLVKDLAPGQASSEPCALTDVDGTLYFGANDPATSQYVLWRSDGTPDGTVELARYPLTQGSCLSIDGYAGPKGFTGFRNRIFFSAADADHGNELWSTDGTPTGTALFKDINPGGDGADTDSYPYSFVVFKGALFFLAFGDLWRSDGTPEGTVLVRDDDPDESWRPHTPSDLMVLGDVILFVARFSGFGDELWRTDGTAAGTGLLKDTAPGPASGLSESLYDRRFAPAGDVLFFLALTGEDAPSGTGAPFEVWRTDGTESATVQLAEITDRRPPRAFAALDGTLYFVTVSSSLLEPPGLWKVDDSGAAPVATLDSADIGGLVTSNGRLYILGHDASNCALWSSDGTAAGTIRVRNGAGCFGGAGDEAVVWLQPYPGGVLFGAVDPDAGYELFRSDGTEPGTVLVADINQTTAAPACAGDCDGDGTVTVSELVRAVDIALGSGPVSNCTAVDVDGNQMVTVSELIDAVNRLLGSC